MTIARAAKDAAEQRMIGAIEAQFDIHAMDPEDFAEMWVEISATLDELIASVDTLPEGGDAKQGLAGTEGSAVPKADAQRPPQ